MIVWLPLRLMLASSLSALSPPRPRCRPCLLRVCCALALGLDFSASRPASFSPRLLPSASPSALSPPRPRPRPRLFRCGLAFIFSASPSALILSPSVSSRTNNMTVYSALCICAHASVSLSKKGGLGPPQCSRNRSYQHPAQHSHCAPPPSSPRSLTPRPHLSLAFLSCCSLALRLDLRLAFRLDTLRLAPSHGSCIRHDRQRPRPPGL